MAPTDLAAPLWKLPVVGGLLAFRSVLADDDFILRYYRTWLEIAKRGGLI